MEQENPLREEKRKKVTRLRERGINAFPYSFDRTHSVESLRAEFPGLNPGDKKESSKVRIAGRVMTIRSMGKASFFNIQDQTGNLQIYIKPEELSETEQF